MKKIHHILGLCLLTAISWNVQATSNAELVEMGRAQLQAERQMIIAKSISVSDSQGKEFWPLYREYRGEVSKIDDKLFALISEYAEAYNSNTLTNDKAMQLLNDATSVEMEKLKLRESYIKKFSKKFPGLLVARYFQLEKKLDSIIDYKFSTEIPLIQ